MDNNDTITIDLSSLDLSGHDYDYEDTVTLDLSGINDLNYAGACETITVSSSGLDSLIFDTGTTDWFEDQRIVEEYKEEKAIRERNEGVQKAWEQYKIMVTLAKNPPENLDNLE